MEAYTYHKFHHALIIPTNNLDYLNPIALKIIPKEWKLILMNDGSFTQNLHSLTGQYIQIRKLYRTSNLLLNKKKSSVLFGLKTITKIN